MLGGLSGVKLVPMIRPQLLVLLALAFGGGCAFDKIDPPPNESMTAPELSHPREPRKSGDPPPPIREDLHQTKSQLITSSDNAPVRTQTAIFETSPAARPVNPTVIEPGVVHPLR